MFYGIGGWHMTTLDKAIKIIVANEGNYASVNPNDNGALSVGICQWHGNRGRALISSICKELAKREDVSTNWLQIAISKDWSKYIPSTPEVNYLITVLSTQIGREQQDKLARKDVQSYINAVMRYDITDADSIIFLADIYNQGGTGAIKRIINRAFEVYGKHATLYNFMTTALEDKVFKNYKTRRYNVYKKLTGSNYIPAGDANMIIHTVAKNETLSGIALRYDTTVKKLVDDNEIENKNKIVAGQKIKIINPMGRIV